MTTRIHDPEVQRLAAIAGIIEQDYRNVATDWAHSPFGWIKALPSRSAGAVFEALVAGWCAAKGLDVTRSPDSDADRIISGLRTEIKGSTLWRNGSYKFQQLRDQNYSMIVCIGISPFDAHCWVIEKATVMALWDDCDQLTTWRLQRQRHRLDYSGSRQPTRLDATLWWNAVPGIRADTIVDSSNLIP